MKTWSASNERVFSAGSDNEYYQYIWLLFWGLIVYLFLIDKVTK